MGPKVPTWNKWIVSKEINVIFRVEICNSITLLQIGSIVFPLDKEMFQVGRELEHEGYHTWIKNRT